MEQKYPAKIRVMHWLIGILVIVTIVIGMCMVGLDDSEYKWQLYGRHKSIGITIFILAIIYVAIKKRTDVPKFPDKLPAVARKFSRATYHSLLLMLILLPLTGYLGAAIAGYTVHFYGIELPKFLPTSKNCGSLFELMHFYLGYLMIGFIVVHVVLLLKFYFLKSVNLFRRMI